MSGSGEGQPQEDKTHEEMALEWLDPKGDIRSAITYFTDRSKDLSSIYADEDAFTEGYTDYWIFRDEAFQEACNQEIKRFHFVVRALTRYIAANSETEQIRRAIQLRVSGLLALEEQWSETEQFTTEDFGLKPNE